MPLDRIDGEILFDIDYNSLEQALRGTGWVTGWEVTGSSASLSVNVSAGEGQVSCNPKRTTSTVNISLDAADPTYPRKDLIIWSASSNALAKVTGLAQAVAPPGESNPRKMKLPAPPDLSSENDILIAVVYVPPGATRGTDCTIIDKRVRLPNLTLTLPDSYVGFETDPYHLAKSSGSSSTIMATNRGWFMPAYAQRELKIGAIRIWVTTPSGNICVAVYNGYGIRLTTSGSIPCPPAGPTLITVPTATIPAGRVYFALSADNTTAGFYRLTPDAGSRRSFYADNCFPLPEVIPSLTEGLRRFWMEAM